MGIVEMNRTWLLCKSLFQWQHVVAWWALSGRFSQGHFAHYWALDEFRAIYWSDDCAVAASKRKNDRPLNVCGFGMLSAWSVYLVAFGALMMDLRCLWCLYMNEFCGSPDDASWCNVWCKLLRDQALKNLMINDNTKTQLTSLEANDLLSALFGRHTTDFMQFQCILKYLEYQYIYSQTLL